MYQVLYLCSLEPAFLAHWGEWRVMLRDLRVPVWAFLKPGGGIGFPGRKPMADSVAGLEQRCLSNLNVHMYYLGSSSSAGLGWGLRICVPVQLLQAMPVLPVLCCLK